MIFPDISSKFRAVILSGIIRIFHDFFSFLLKFLLEVRLGFIQEFCDGIDPGFFLGFVLEFLIKNLQVYFEDSEQQLINKSSLKL